MPKPLALAPHTTQTQAGQVGVIILLIMVVLLTVGLSVASRSTQDLFLSQQQSETTRVFNAAEAGIEEALSGPLDFSDTVTSGSLTSIEDTAVNYTVNKIRQLDTRLFEGLSVKVDLTGVTDGQEVVFLWSKDDDCNTQDPASLVVSVYYDDAGNTKVRHYGLGACNRNDGFTLASTVNTEGFRRSYALPLQTGDLFLHVKSVYNDTHIKATGNGWTMPVQYFNIRSEATSELGNETRIVEVNRTLSSAPSIMDYTVYSGSTIIK